MQAEGVAENPLLAEPDAGDGRFRFRTPSLRNVAVTAPYMHNGMLVTLEEVLAFYDRGRSENPNVSNRRRRRGDDDRADEPPGPPGTLSGRFRGVDDMTDQQMQDIIVFLRALTDPDFDRTIPAPGAQRPDSRGEVNTMPTSTNENLAPASPSSRSPSDLTRREWLAGTGAGAAALLLNQRPLRAAAPSGIRLPAQQGQDGRVHEHHRGQPRRRTGRRGSRGRGQPDRGDRPHGRGARRLSRCRAVRGARQGALPGPHQLSRPHAGSRRARLQRGLRLPEHREPGDLARQSPRGGGRQSHGAGRRARGHTHRDHHHRRVHREHSAPGGGIGRLGAPLRVRGRDPRRRERSRPGVHEGNGRDGQRVAPVLGEAARRGYAAHQRPVQ